jgi:drug/metabolite transporter (DMT)-like permease
MYQVFIWTFIFSLATTASIVLIGQRDLISGNLFEIKRILLLITNWKFIASMAFALLARTAFIITNNSLLKIPSLAQSSTTITTFITLFSLILVVLANYIFLKERINVQQGAGAMLIMFGIWIMLR